MCFMYISMFDKVAKSAFWNEAGNRAGPNMQTQAEQSRNQFSDVYCGLGRGIQMKAGQNQEIQQQANNRTRHRQNQTQPN